MAQVTPQETFAKTADQLRATVRYLTKAAEILEGISDAEELLECTEIVKTQAGRLNVATKWLESV